MKNMILTLIVSICAATVGVAIGLMRAPFNYLIAIAYLVNSVCIYFLFANGEKKNAPRTKRDTTKQN